MKILNHNGPRFRIFGGINVQNKTDNMGLRFVHVHTQLRIVAIQTESIGVKGSKFRIDPSFGIMLQFFQDLQGRNKETKLH
jgi:hypothetical protein